MERREIGLSFSTWLLSPFLCIGIMFANFHSSGISPKHNDLLKIWVREGAISHNVSFRSRDGISSGPVALVESSARSVVSWRSKCSNVEGEDDITEERLTGFSSYIIVEN